MDVYLRFVDDDRLLLIFYAILKYDKPLDVRSEQVYALLKIN